MLTNLSLCCCFSVSSCNSTCLSIISITHISSFLSLSLSEDQLVCFPSEREKLLNMEEEEWNWHQHNIPLTWASLNFPFSLSFVFSPLAPLILFLSLPEHTKHMDGECLGSCADTLNTYDCLSVQYTRVRNTVMHVWKHYHLLDLCITWSCMTAYLCSYLCQYYVCFCNYAHHQPDLAVNRFFMCFHNNLKILIYFKFLRIL